MLNCKFTTEFTMSETPVTKRKPRRRKTSQLSSSVLVLNSVTKVDGDELRDDAVFEDENQPSALRHESSQHSEGENDVKISVKIVFQFRAFCVFS